MLPEPWLKEVGDQVVQDYIEDDQNSSLSEMPQVKHVIEHTIAEPKQQQQQQQNPYQLPPIQQVGGPPPPPVIVQQPPPPPIVSMQQPNPPAIIQAGAPQHIITGYPQPVIHNLGAPSNNGNSGGGMFNKAEMGDMMMMQNAQLHQMVMQKMMLNELGGNSGLGLGGRTHSSCSSHHHGHGHHHHGCSCATCVPVTTVPRVGGGAVHHHHYTSPPPSQPAVHHYTSLPAMDIRGGYPLRDYSSAYTAPGYAYAGYDDGNNYYTYH